VVGAGVYDRAMNADEGVLRILSLIGCGVTVVFLTFLVLVPPFGGVGWQVAFALGAVSNAWVFFTTLTRRRPTWMQDRRRGGMSKDPDGFR
jgi:hypothetical protein